MTETGQVHKRTLASALAVAVFLLLGSIFGVAPSRADYTLQANINYDLGSPPSDPASNMLDIYLPSAPSPSPRPLVIHVHGGGWRTGDKANPSIPDKASLFTGLGYGFVSINYRLSPTTGDPDNPDPDRIMFPDHPDDVGEAIGWLDRNASSYGLDPDRMILMGHSAGAHLVSLISTDHRYIGRHGVDPRQILGTISLDTAAFDIEKSVLGSDPDEPSLLFINAFGTAEENAATNSWEAASPLSWADPSDPRHLFIVQTIPYRIDRQLTMATRLGQTAESVVPVPLSHNGINQAVGAPGDSSGTTTAVTGFVSSLLSGYRPPGVAIRRRPAKVVRVGRRSRRRKVVFVFSPVHAVGGFRCRMDSGGFRPCTSPKSFRLKRGRHRFRVRPLYPSGRPGPVKLVKFRIVNRRR